MKNLPLKLTKILKPYMGKSHLLAVSGGLDSMALFHIYLHFRQHFSMDFAVAHYHHGSSGDFIQENYRSNALEFVKFQCQKQEVPFFSNKIFDSSPSGKDSEADLRKWRYTFLESVLRANSYDLLVLAHHRDDLLETRMIRLIRGVGPEGLESMSTLRDHLFRPLLDCSRDELKTHLKLCSGSWLEDPWNEDQRPLRNWLRKKWLKDLKDRDPGALTSLSRSLETLIKTSQSAFFCLESCFENDQVVLSEFFCLNRDQKRQVLATYMRSHGLKNYGFSHINEILKRLDSEKKTHSFKLLGWLWTVDKGRISLSKN